MFRTSASVQLYDYLEIWYPDGKKIVPKNISLTPTTLLHWHIGDGSTGKKQIFLYTQRFPKADVEFLSKLIEKEIGIETHVYKKYDKRYPDKDYYYIGISHQDNIKKYFSYLDKADPESVKLAKELFPWKFDLKVTINQ